MRTLIKKINIDMLNGSIVDKLFIFVIPLALTSLLQQFFISTDMLICGRYVGSLALAAIGANTHIVNLFANIFIGISIGINVMTVSYIGEQKKEKLVNVVHTSISFALIIGIILLIIGEIFSERLLVLLGTPAEILNLSCEYLKIYFLGIPFFVVYNFGTVILRSVGDTNRPLIVLIIVGI